jgi:GntR family transcriptional regulator, sialic acid-inducible nan operon repressor
MNDRVMIDRRKLFEQVAAHIQRDILDGTLKPGDRLPPERDLQLRFGVGRPAVREALITLQRSGLIEIGNGAPARVAMPTAQGVVAGLMPAVLQMLQSPLGQKHFQDVRLFVESGLARRAARDATDEDVAKLRAALEANRKAVGSRRRFIETDVAFHFTLAEITRNPVFIALHDAMSTWLRQQRAVSLGMPNQEEIAYAAHEQIFKAIEKRDPNAAEAAMAAHIVQLTASYWSALEK